MEYIWRHLISEFLKPQSFSPTGIMHTLDKAIDTTIEMVVISVIQEIYCKLVVPDCIVIFEIRNILLTVLTHDPSIREITCLKWLQSPFVFCKSIV